MARLLNVFRLFIIIIFAGLSASAEDIYLSPTEKALIATSLKALQTNTSHVDESKYLIKNLISQIKALRAKPVTQVEVESYAEFLEKQKNSSLFAEHSLEQLNPDDLFRQFENLNYFSRSEKVQRKIEHYNQIKNQKALELTTSIIAINLDFFNNTDDITIENIEKKIKEKLSSHINDFSAKLSQKNSAQVLVLTKLLKAYFKALPTYQKAEILYRLIQLPIQSKPIDAFLVMIQNSGPQMQKLVQIIGRSDDIPEEFKAVFQKLEDDVQAVPWWQVQEVLEAEGVSVKNDFTYFERKPIGVGTMGQSHRAQIIDEYGNRHSDVVKFLKPGIEKALEMDHQILIRISTEIDSDPELEKFNLPSLAKLIEDLHGSVEEELHINDTVLNQIKAKPIYSMTDWISYSGQKNKINFIVADASLFGKNSNLMLQDLVFGKKPEKEFKNYSDIYPELYAAVAEKTAEHWLEQAFFKSGFFHADLHQGNILMRVTDESIQVSLLDFGMVGQLNNQLKESALLLALGINLDKPELIAKHFMILSKQSFSGEKANEFIDAVRARVEASKTDTEVKTSIEAWTAWALDHGISLQYEFLKLNRGLTAIEGLLQDSKNTTTVEDLAQKIALKNKFYVTQLLLKEPLISISDYKKLAAKLFERTSQTDKQGTKSALQAISAVQCKNLFK